ncbi:hypothetical protein HC251_04525 [Iamia sp. SCSIO 61187]|uniref:hypothetical protein n=1 Tax=Iamia sp. SCSIO 61187 TaxID=2722752 RepID=UPI001C62B036|nr:hypothetical protein [Iamia sp. SCSIO 61187]QYG91775.1 hypothetical protein HC251_04525 [Iamia sp. SCSIO 61187]
MGWRTIELELAEQPTPPMCELLGQIVAVAEHFGVAGALHAPPEFPGVWELTLDANSSYLNGITPPMCDVLEDVANDIDPADPFLRDTAATIRTQLESQLVDNRNDPPLRLARAGQDFHVRATGDASPAFHLTELAIHEGRLLVGIEQFAGASGARAWHRRYELEAQLRIDGLALVGAARRLRRTADHLATEIPGAHLEAAKTRFDAAVPDLVHLRDCFEHIDEYAVGAGRRDPPGSPAGTVLELDICRDDGSLHLSARGRNINPLDVASAARTMVACLQAAIDHHAIFRILPGFADFEFVDTVDGMERAIPVEDEDPERQRIRSMLNSMKQTAVPAAACPHCGLPL